ncbi:MAG TPA: hypothetical protein VJ302_11555, partial [Blastocatellia bacterium]|nr:hypothetical protein [Blastocatellia bacterium]
MLDYERVSQLRFTAGLFLAFIIHEPTEYFGIAKDAKVQISRSASQILKNLISKVLSFGHTSVTETNKQTANHAEHAKSTKFRVFRVVRGLERWRYIR